MLQINGSTKLLGILGQGISYTLSPLIHNAAAEALGKNSVYVPFDMPAATIKPFLQLLWDCGGLGFNVTTPYKPLIASMIGGHTLSSVNTVYRGAQGWQAASTDGAGFAAGLGRLGTPLSGFTRIVILGNGGASTAILSYLAMEFERPPEVVVLRRDAEKDASFKKALPPAFPVRFAPFQPDALTREVMGRSGETLVIQATSAPVRGDRLIGFADALRGFRGVLVELVYGHPSALLDKMRSLGLPCQDGLPMLIEQARLSQKLWWGEAAPYEELASLLRTRVG